MENINETISNQTCRFCHQFNDQMEGCKICDCDGQHGYAHYSCFYSFVQITGRRQCEYCKKTWLVDKSMWKRYVLQYTRVSIMNRVREAASLLLTLMVFLSMAFIWAYLVKVCFWVTTGRPDYLAFGRLELASSGWIQPTLGDAFTGMVAALLNTLIAVIVIQYKAKCYRCCCIKTFKTDNYQMSTYPAESDDMEAVPTSDAHKLDTLLSRRMSRHMSRQVSSIEDTVQLGFESYDESSSSQGEVPTIKKPSVLIVNEHAS